MSAISLQAEAGIRERAREAGRLPWFSRALNGTIQKSLLTLAIAAIPISIAVTEVLLAGALATQIFRLARGQIRIRLPRIFWGWLALATIEIGVWLCSPSLKDGWGEMRHVLLVASLFLILPAFEADSAKVAAWEGLFLGSAVGALFLIGDFISRLIYYRREIAVGDDVSFYLRTGGLLNNWMVYGTVEVLIFAGLLSFWFTFPEHRRRWWPVLVVNSIAVVLSLTRTLWVAVVLILFLQLLLKRSRWLVVLPFWLAGCFFLAPGAIRSRLKVSMNPDYFSNAERIQMLQVGWRMASAHPWLGVGPGRVEKLYVSYLDPSAAVPKYHGHLHNNLAQMAAQFGIPAAMAAILFVLLLTRELARVSKKAESRESRFLSQAGLFSLFGFVVAGCFDYTFGHSLNLILLAFAVLCPLMNEAATLRNSAVLCEPSSASLPRLP